MSDHPNVETVKLMMEAIFSQDNDTLAKIVTDDFVFHFRAPHPRSRHHRHPTRVVSPARANQEPHHVCLRRCGPQPAHPGRLAAPSGRSGPAGGVARHPPATTSRGTTRRTSSIASRSSVRFSFRIANSALIVPACNARVRYGSASA
jgi:hypothetical protein